MAVQAMQAIALQPGPAETEGDWAVDGCRGLAALMVMLAHYGVLFQPGVLEFAAGSGFLFASACAGLGCTAARAQLRAQWRLVFFNTGAGGGYANPNPNQWAFTY